MSSKAKGDRLRCLDTHFFVIIINIYTSIVLRIVFHVMNVLIISTNQTVAPAPVLPAGACLVAEAAEGRDTG